VQRVASLTGKSMCLRNEDFLGKPHVEEPENKSAIQSLKFGEGLEFGGKLGSQKRVLRASVAPWSLQKI
jgi:hypothetical protein